VWRGREGPSSWEGTETDLPTVYIARTVLEDICDKPIEFSPTALLPDCTEYEIKIRKICCVRYSELIVLGAA
jgi:hypothetical protein